MKKGKENRENVNNGNIRKQPEVNKLFVCSLISVFSAFSAYPADTLPSEKKRGSTDQ